MNGFLSSNDFSLNLIRLCCYDDENFKSYFWRQLFEFLQEHLEIFISRCPWARLISAARVDSKHTPSAHCLQHFRWHRTGIAVACWVPRKNTFRFENAFFLYLIVIILPSLSSISLCSRYKSFFGTFASLLTRPLRMWQESGESQTRQKWAFNNTEIRCAGKNASFQL